MEADKNNSAKELKIRVGTDTSRSRIIQGSGLVTTSIPNTGSWRAPCQISLVKIDQRALGFLSFFGCNSDNELLHFYEFGTLIIYSCTDFISTVDGILTPFKL